MHNVVDKEHACRAGIKQRDAQRNRQIGVILQARQKGKRPLLRLGLQARQTGKQPRHAQADRDHAKPHQRRHQEIFRPPQRRIAQHGIKNERRQ
jgi:hypothetical protein